MVKVLVLLLTSLLLIGSLATGQSKLGGTAKVSGTAKTGTAAAGPTDFVNDTFTDTDTTTLASHTGETGATWTLHTTCTGTISIRSNRAHKDNASPATCYYASGTAPSGTNYSVEGVLVDLTAETRSARICGWMDTTTFTAVCAGRVNSTTMELIKFINGTATQQDTLTITYTQDLNRTVKVTRSGTDYEWFVDGASQGTTSITDTELSGAGRVGVRMTGTWPADSTYPITSLHAFQ